MILTEERRIFKGLPSSKGRYFFDYFMEQTTWFKVGGPADILFKPTDLDDLISFLKKKPSDLLVTCVGAGSNLLVRDGGIEGCVVKLGAGFSAISIEGETILVGAGCLDRTVVMKCQELCLSGLEFLVGVPGTIGGALAMNAGAYGNEVKDFLKWVELVDQKGELHQLSAEEISMSYRCGNLPKCMIVTRAAFQCTKQDPIAIEKKIISYLRKREESQPIKGRTGGSTFKNPSEEIKAWKLIDQAGCRGLRIGDAQVSEKHCNFLLNLSRATAYDLEKLGNTVKTRVRETSGYDLEWEIIRIGSPLKNQDKEG